MKLSVIANPIAGGGRAYRRICRYVLNRRVDDWNIEILTTRGRGHAGVLAGNLIADPPDLLAVCGGDGTVNEVATAVPSPPFPVAILPAGTANVLARELRLPLDPIEALRIALRRTVKRVDLGILDPGSRRRFLFAAGVGFDAYTASRVQPQVKARFGMAAYVPAILHCLRSYAFPEFQVEAGGRVYTATSCLASNTRSYGGGLLLSPDADMCDGVLDVLVLEGRRRLELARFLFLAWCGKAENRVWVHRLRSAELRMEGPPDVPVQADGEQAGGLPLHIRLVPAVFPLVFPP
jgi:YegS/Rv2252/BmrU family lipid kinase